MEASATIELSGNCATSAGAASQHALESVTALRSLEASLPGIVGALHAARALPPTSARARANFKKRGEEVSIARSVRERSEPSEAAGERREPTAAARQPVSAYAAARQPRTVRR